MGVFIIGSLTVALLITLPLTATAFIDYENPSDHQQSDIPGYSPVDAQDNNYRSIYKSALMLQPHRSVLNESQSNKETGVKVEVTLKSFTDQGLRLPGGMTCACPRDHLCSYLGTTEARCFMSFTVIISSPGDSVRYMTTEFAPLSASGKLDFPKMTQEQVSQWNHPHVFQLNSKPSAIDIFVHHMGVVINAQNGELTQMQTVVHVDTFLLPLFNVVPSIGGSLEDHSQSLDGQILHTQLELSYGVQCTGSAVGPDCDLHCNRSTVSSSIAICESVRTAFLYTCSYTSGTKQVHDCKPCPWGIAEDSYCRDDHGGVLHPSSASVVPPGYKTATITLAVVAGVLFVLLGLVTIFALMKQKKLNEEAPGHNYHSSLRAEGRANSPLLQATYTAQSPVPTPAPRCEPNLGAIPTKSALRQTNYIPPAHLGGQASVNDTLNSSFASVPMPPSVEADV